jgi:hypothetical protein
LRIFFLKKNNLFRGLCYAKENNKYLAVYRQKDPLMPVLSKAYIAEIKQILKEEGLFRTERPAVSPVLSNVPKAPNPAIHDRYFRQTKCKKRVKYERKTHDKR